MAEHEPPAAADGLAALALIAAALMQMALVVGMWSPGVRSDPPAGRERPTLTWLRVLPELAGAENAEVGHPAPDVTIVSAASDATSSTPQGMTDNTRPPEALDATDGLRPALAITTPDWSLVGDLDLPTGLIWLRLHIDADGVVQRVDIVAAAPQDARFATRLAALWQVTRHTPARRAGMDVASVKDLRIEPVQRR